MWVLIKIRGKEGDVERLHGQVESPKWKVKKLRTDSRARNTAGGFFGVRAEE